MPIGIKEPQIDHKTERMIITNLIVSSEFCNQIISIIKEEIFEIPYAKKIFRWVKEYFEIYKKAPSQEIKDIFIINSKKLQESEQLLVEEFLLSISHEYDNSSNKNVQFYVDRAVEYIKKRSFLILAEELSAYAKQNKIKDCENLLVQSKSTANAATGIVDPFDPEFIKTAMEINDTDSLFKFPGKLGELLPPVERGRLYSFMGQPKVGKTFCLREVGIIAVMNRLKVFEINCEMSSNKILNRHLKRICNLGSKAKTQKYPVFDCSLNQTNQCQKPERTNFIPLILRSGDIPEFGSHNPKYKPCSICRGSRDYQIAIWYESEEHKEQLDVETAIKTSAAWNLMYGQDNYRLRCYPKFSANCRDIIKDLEFLEYNQGFIPDVIIVDYADILKPESDLREVRHQLDETWKTLGRIASERKAAVWTATQTNRQGAERKSIKTTDIAEDFKKLAHVDCLITINMTPKEHDMGIRRIGVGIVRDDNFDIQKQIMITQNLDTGQVILDSEFCDIVENN